MRFLPALLAVSSTLLLGACGYHVGPIKPTPMKNVTRVCVPNFKNETLEPRISALMANELIKQLQQDGTYQVTDEGRADVIIQGTITDVERKPARSLRGNIEQTREYLLNIKGRYRTTYARSDVVIEERSITGTTSFFVTGENLLSADTHQDERQAIPLAAQDFAQRVTSLVSEGW